MHKGFVQAKVQMRTSLTVMSPSPSTSLASGAWTRVFRAEKIRLRSDLSTLPSRLISQSLNSRRHCGPLTRKDHNPLAKLRIPLTSPLNEKLSCGVENNDPRTPIVDPFTGSTSKSDDSGTAVLLNPING